MCEHLYCTRHDELYSEHLLFLQDACLQVPSEEYNQRIAALVAEIPTKGAGNKTVSELSTRSSVSRNALASMSTDDETEAPIASSNASASEEGAADEDTLQGNIVQREDIQDTSSAASLIGNIPKFAIACVCFAWLRLSLFAVTCS